MKIKDDFVKIRIADECFVVPVGEQAVDFYGIITLNGTAEFMWDCLEEDKTREELITVMLEEYDIDRTTAETDIDEFIGVLIKNNLFDKG